MIVTASTGLTNEPVASSTEDNVHVGNVARLLANAKLLGALEGLVNGHDWSILFEQLEKSIKGGRHVWDGSYVFQQ